MASKRLVLLSAVFILLSFLSMPYLVSALEEFRPRPRPWERVESLGRCKLRTRGVDRPGAAGRGKYYDPGIKSLWHLDRLIVDHVRHIDRTRDNRWAFVASQVHPKEPVTELLLVDLQRGAIDRSFPLPGPLMQTCLDSPGLRIALGVQDRNDPGRSHLIVIDTTQSQMSARAVYSGSGNVVQFPTYAWSPDSTAIAFETVHWQPGATRFTFLHLTLTPHVSLVETRESGGQYSIDWSDPLHPR